MERRNTEGRAQEWNAAATRVLKHKTLHPVKLLSRRRVRNNAGEDYGKRLKTIVARIHDEFHSPRFPKVLLIIYARKKSLFSPSFNDSFSS